MILGVVETERECVFLFVYILCAYTIEQTSGSRRVADVLWLVFVETNRSVL